MSNFTPTVITISRQLGSGGTYLGQRLSDKLNLLYLDREIVEKAAAQLGCRTEQIVSLDEAVISKWKETINYIASAQKMLYSTLEYFPTNTDIFEAEKEVIVQVVKSKSAIIIGRCGSYLLHNHPRHASIFLHACEDFRINRIKEMYGISNDEAAKVIEVTDRSRAHYVHKFTGRDMNDVRQYHLAVDTGVIGLEAAEELILNYVNAKFGECL
jgi:cytidylate kinase